MSIIVWRSDTGAMSMRLLRTWITLAWVPPSVQSVASWLPIRTDHLLKVTIWRCVDFFSLTDRNRIPVLIHDYNRLSDRCGCRR